jgi:hypothetical protein
VGRGVGAFYLGKCPPKMKKWHGPGEVLPNFFLGPKNIEFKRKICLNLT